MDFIIAGSGIGGLSCANALVRGGHNVCIVERTPELKPVGAGISLQPNAMQAIKFLELDEQVRAVSWPADLAKVLSSSGKVLKTFDFSGYESEYESLPMTVYRGDLIRALADGLNGCEGKSKLVLDQAIVSFEESGKGVTVRTSMGSEFSGDALIAADGIHSAVREQLWGEQTIRYSGYTCWRGIVDNPKLVENVDTMTEVWGRGARFGFMRCNERQVYWFATEDRKQRSDHLPKNPAWKSQFQSWPDPIPNLLESTSDELIVHNDLIDLKPMTKWSRGRITLLGDAAHAMTPNFGQGGAQAIEDAVCLALAIKKSDDIDSAFRLYESLRIPRTIEIVNGAWSFGKIAQGSTWIKRFLRNQVMTKLPKRFVDKQLSRQFDFNGWMKRCLKDLET